MDRSVLDQTTGFADVRSLAVLERSRSLSVDARRATVADMTTFALVHGAWHGAWCWELLEPRLHALGHQVINMDLPSDDSTETFETYADVVARAVSEVGADDTVVVGHSLAGLTIPLVAARQPVKRLVYLCALVPNPGRSFVDQMGEEDMLDRSYLAGMSGPDVEGRRAWIDEDLARQVLFGDCPEDVAQSAFNRLRPQAVTPYSQICPLDDLSTTPSTYVVCNEDRLVNPDWSRTVARHRLNADIIELPGSHSPFLSRPAELAALLHDLA
jgi:pimeloyl-ACP methyl ester carboxylesterase